MHIQVYIHNLYHNTLSVSTHVSQIMNSFQKPILENSIFMFTKKKSEIFENNIISVELVKVIKYAKL